MKVFLNAISIATGGGFVVLSHLLEKMHQLDPSIKWFVASTPNTLSKLPISPQIISIPFTWVNRTPAHHLYWYEMVLPKLLWKTQADICFSQTNFLSRRRLPCPSLLLIQNAGYFSTIYENFHLNWNNKPIHKLIWSRKKSWMYQSIKKATAVTVQTQALADRINKLVGVDKEKLFVVPHGSGLLRETVAAQKKYPKDDIFKIGYITKLGYQKDFKTAFEAISLLKRKNIPVKLILTLDENATSFFPMLKQIREQIAYYGIEECVENLGEVTDANEIDKIYQSLDIFIYPSLCESFGFTLVEAMAAGLPIVASNTDSNCELIGNQNHIFAAENAYDLADKIVNLIHNKELYLKSSRQSADRAKAFSWEHTARSIISIMEQMTNQSNAN
jgi:glycosyltransferase involved in cell wall biosynthesis